MLTSLHLWQPFARVSRPSLRRRTGDVQLLINIIANDILGPLNSGCMLSPVLRCQGDDTSVIAALLAYSQAFMIHNVTIRTR
jgi:hypothetical protein